MYVIIHFKKFVAGAKLKKLIKSSTSFETLSFKSMALKQAVLKNLSDFA